MADISYAVSVVLDPEYGPQTCELLKKGPVWIVESAMNRESAQKLWAEFPERDHLSGVTLFKTAATDPATILIGEMPTIDLHHGEYSADPAYTVIRVIGCKLNSEVQENLEEYGFDSFICTNDGFEATRPLPHSTDA